MKPNWANRTLWTGDNLDIMRGMNSETVDLIYLDPPFNSNKNYSAPIGSEAAGAAFKDTWALSDVDEAWHGEIADRDPALYAIVAAAGLSHGKGMKSYLIMMAVRLMEMKRILKDAGSIYLHCDPTASHYLKMLMDTIFEPGRFRNDICWQRTSSHNDSKKWAQIHDIILFYGGPDFSWNSVYLPHSPEHVAKFYRFRDDRGLYRKHEIIRTASMGPRPNLSYEYKGYTPEWGWRMVLSKVEALDRDDRIIWSSTGRPYLKRYLHEQKGTLISSVIADIPPLSHAVSTAEQN